MLPNLNLMMIKIYIPTTQTLTILKIALFFRFTRQFDLQRSMYGQKIHFSHIFLLNSYRKLNFMYLTNYLESLKCIQKLPTCVCYAGKVTFLKNSGFDPLYDQSPSGTRFTTKMISNVILVVELDRIRPKMHGSTKPFDIIVWVGKT